MSAKDQIKQIVDYFKREPQLKDKTDGMAEGLLLGANLADEANERSKEATTTTKAIQDKYKEQILAQDLNPNKDPELVDLRNGYDTAGERIKKSFYDIAVQLDKFKIPELDDTPRILRAIASLPNTGGAILLPQGETLISRLIEITKPNVSILSLGGTTIKLADMANSSLLWAKEGADNFHLENIFFDGNAENQTHVMSTSTPFVSNTALVMVQSNNARLKYVHAFNTKLKGFYVGGYTDGSDSVINPILDHATTENTLGTGIQVTFAKQPLITSCHASLVGGKFVKVTDVNVATKTITTEEAFTHKTNTKIAFFRMSGNMPKFMGSVTKGPTNPENADQYTFNNLLLKGGEANLIYYDDLYLLSAEGYGIGIVASNCDSPLIIASSAELTSGMGLAIVQDRGSLGSISDGKARWTGEEAFCIDGTRFGSIKNSDTMFASLNSKAPAIHIANASPGIDDPIGNGVLSCKVINPLATAINAGVNNVSFGFDATRVADNVVFLEPALNWDLTDTAIITTGKAYVVDNELINVLSGIDIVSGDRCIAKDNKITGRKTTGSFGVRSLNSARTMFEENNIDNVEKAFVATGQGEYKLKGNYISGRCDVALSAAIGGTATVYMNNKTHAGVLFENAIPESVDDYLFDVYIHKTDIKYARSNYSIPVTVTPGKEGYLKVIGDGSLTNPSEKIYRVARVSGIWLVSTQSSTEQNSAIVSSSVSINASTGQLTISITGTGGGKALAYSFSTDQKRL